MDYFQLEGWHYLVMVDRFSGWSEVRRAKVYSGSKGLITAMRQLFGIYGVPWEASSNQGREFESDETRDFFDRWGIDFQPSSAYHPISNGRAELGVKSMKRLLQDNIGPEGSLDTDEFLRAILAHRNTPDQLSKKSPAQVIFGHQLRDALPVFGGTDSVFDDDKVLPLWREAWSLKERALRTRAARTVETLTKRSKDLPALRHGDTVFVQNQTGNHPNKWDRTGVVTECRPHNQYTVKIDASGRLTVRNRQFLRKFTPTRENVLLGIPFNTEGPINETTGEELDVHVPEETVKTVRFAQDSDNVSDVHDRTIPDAIQQPPRPEHDSSQIERPREAELVEPTPPQTRRSTRSKQPTGVYDPTSGKYVPRTR